MTYTLKDPLDNNNRGADQTQDQNQSEAESRVTAGSERNSAAATNADKTKKAGKTKSKKSKKSKKPKKSSQTEHGHEIQWEWYERQEDEEDFGVRNSQVCKKGGILSYPIRFFWIKYV